MIKNADQAMYAAKNSGRNQMHYFTQGMQEAALNRLEVVNKLRYAIKAKQFQISINTSPAHYEDNNTNTATMGEWLN